MYGVCGKRKDGDPLNCPRNVAAEAPDADLGEKLQAVCPSLWAEQGGEQGRYCCTADQVERISTDVGGGRAEPSRVNRHVRCP